MIFLASAPHVDSTFGPAGRHCFPCGPREIILHLPVSASHLTWSGRIATLPGYDFSPALKRLDIVWTPETVSKLFELRPATFTPGTKMPEQKITGADDRAALVKFLEKATK